MRQSVNQIYNPLFTQRARYIILLGGRGGGRSTVASQFVLAKLMAPEFFRCAIMRFVYGDIRNSIFQEIVDRSEEQEVQEKLEIKEHTLTIDYGQNKSAFNKERILYWLKQGAKMSVTANNFLIDAKIVEGKKKPAHKISKKKEEKMAAAVEAKPAEAKV